jgi:hypothetical protein
MNNLEALKQLAQEQYMELFEGNPDAILVTDARGRITQVNAQRLMNASMVVILYERDEFSFEILSIPNEDAVKVFAANCSNESLNEGM